MTLVALLMLACERHNRDAANIYLASSLMPLQDDIKELAKDIGPIDLIFLSSSSIARQIEQGAPCEIAILADEKWRDHLVSKGAVITETASMGTNTLVVASLTRIGGLESVRGLLDGLPDSEKLIIADPDFVPLGAYTKEALENLGLYDKFSSRLVRAHSARSAGLLFKQKAANLAVLYRSDAISEGMHLVGEIDKMLHRPIHYPLVICKQARMKAAMQLRKVLLSQEFKKILAAKGFY